MNSVHRKVFLNIGIIASVVMLGYFKYFNFFINSMSKLFDFSVFRAEILLPIGISFYVFSGIAFLVEVYKHNVKENNMLAALLYMSFFGKLTAGPIVRPQLFLEQFHNYRGIELSYFGCGCQIFVFGLFKKMVLADRLGVFVDDIFYAPMAYDTSTVLLAIVSYSLQIYFDFSGYSDMAIGLSKIVGFDYLSNFNLPYIAKGMSDFWKRWHISLSSWFQDYLYIPLGGSRKGSSRTYLNLIIVMLISGIWHGAGYTFLAWGLCHGICSCISKLVSKLKIAKNKYFGYFRMVITYVCVTLLWVIFRADSLEKAVLMYKRAFTIHSGIHQMYFWSYAAIILLLIAILAARIKSKGKLQVDGYYPILDLSKISELIIFFTFCGLTILLGYYGNTAFIYGKF